MSGPNDRQRVNVSLPVGFLHGVDAVCEEYSLSRSRVIADAAERGLCGDDVEESILELIPDATLRLAEKERKEREMLDRQKEREKQHSYEDRILGHYRKRLEGDAAYSPEGMRDLAEGYREDARIWFDDPDVAEEKAAKNDEWLSWYEMGYEARQHADDVETEVNGDDVNGWFDVGRDVHRLREHLKDVVAHIREVADGSSGWDADAVIDSVASEWSVSRGATHLLIESLAVEHASVQEAIAVGGETLRAAEDLALEGGGPQGERELPEADGSEAIEPSSAGGRTDGQGGQGASGTRPGEADRDDGLETADLTPEEAIEAAVDAIEAGDDPERSLDVRGFTSTPTELRAAAAAARERLADEDDATTDGGTADSTVATDGGEPGD